MLYQDGYGIPNAQVFAELNFHVCQFHFAKLWSAHCPSWSFLFANSHFAKIMKSTLPNSQVNMARSTFPSWQLHIAILSNFNDEKLEVGINDLCMVLSIDNSKQGMLKRIWRIMQSCLFTSISFRPTFHLTP